MRNPANNLPDEGPHPVPPRTVSSAYSVVHMSRLLAERSFAATRERWRLSMPRPSRGPYSRNRNGAEPVAPAAHPSETPSGNKSRWGHICGLFAVDIAAFSEPQRDDDLRQYMHESLYNMLEMAFDGSNVPWADCSHEDRGDGAFVVVPPTIAATRLIFIPDRLRILIRRHNRRACPEARMQLRIAIHVGPIYPDGHGIVGSDVTLLFRLLDAQQLKKKLAASSAEMALITSDYFYGSIIRRQPFILDPDLFDMANIRVKETRARAWIYLPD
jgi:class 3 adenylate cyclase